MRLLRARDDDEFTLVEFIGRQTPPYAILSHTWGRDEDELVFRDIIEGTGKSKLGYDKLRFCRNQARLDKLEYFWIDTCCIDKTNSVELSEAINSMFKWYKRATVCYVYLSDVSEDQSGETSSANLELSFAFSRWHTRGWTLQELLAPASVRFYSQEGILLGDKITLVEELSKITKIPTEVLKGRDVREISVEERMSWVKNRTTRREEDEVYSLLGLFDTFMPLIYGEGRERALARLHKELREVGLIFDTGTTTRQQFSAAEVEQMRSAMLDMNHFRENNKRSRSDYDAVILEHAHKIDAVRDGHELLSRRVQAIEEQLSAHTQEETPTKKRTLKHTAVAQSAPRHVPTAVVHTVETLMPARRREESLEAPPSDPEYYSILPTWPGDAILNRSSSSPFDESRDLLSDAAKFGRWEKAFQLLNMARDERHENWANSVRQRGVKEANQLSFWTPLHQAAFIEAPINVVKSLINMGALRTIRTRQGPGIPNCKFHDLTPLDLARLVRAKNLIDILTPVIRHPVPHEVLARLQILFHDMIKADFGKGSFLILPDLVPLTELKEPEMWFPIKNVKPVGGYVGGDSRLFGYHYKLVGRELIVGKLGIEKKSPSVYKLKLR